MGAFKVVLLIVAALVFGQVTDWRAADQLALALIVLLIVARLWSRLSLRGLRLRRHMTADRGQVGELIIDEIEVRNLGRLAKLWLEVIDYSTLPNHTASRVVHIRGRRGVRWRVETRCVRRGRYVLGPVTLASGDPLGMFPSRRELPDVQELVVYPATVNLRGFPSPGGILSGGNAVDRRNPFVTPSVSGVREYAPGDSFNRMSWAATARMGHLMVKEFDLDPTADVWLVIDLHQASHLAAERPLSLVPNAGGLWPIEAWLDSTEEYGVTIGASLAGYFLDQGRNVGMIATAAHHEVIPPERSTRQRHKILEALAVIHADGHFSLAEALVAEGRRFTRHGSLIVITPAVDEAWVRAFTGIVGRGVRGAAVIVEPATFGRASSSLLAFSSLVAAGVPTHLVKYGDLIAPSLLATHGSRPIAGSRRG